MKRSPTTATSGERLQKILSQAGVSSRRAAEEMIRTGRVTVNGKTVTELGTKANPWTDRIAVDGKPLRHQAPPVYILLHKPVGVVTTLDDPAGRPTVRDLLKGIRTRVFPVGRLDYHSAGLLLLTNDGGLALQLTHPRYGVRKTYQVKVKGEPQPNQLATLAAGVRLPDGQTNPAEVHVLRRRDQKAWLSITLAEGKNRQVRRMCEAVGLPVEKLVRVAFGGLKLSNLAPGQWRHLEPEEIALLHRPQAVRPAAPSRPRGHQRRPRDGQARGRDDRGRHRDDARRGREDDSRLRPRARHAPTARPEPRTGRPQRGRADAPPRSRAGADARPRDGAAPRPRTVRGRVIGAGRTRSTAFARPDDERGAPRPRRAEPRSKAPRAGRPQRGRSDAPPASRKRGTPRPDRRRPR